MVGIETSFSRGAALSRVTLSRAAVDAPVAPLESLFVKAPAIAVAPLESLFRKAAAIAVAPFESLFRKAPAIAVAPLESLFRKSPAVAVAPLESLSPAVAVALLRNLGCGCFCCLGVVRHGVSPLHNRGFHL